MSIVEQALASVDAQRAGRSKPRGRASQPRRLDYVAASDLPLGEVAFDDELVEGVVSRNSMGVVFGESNSAKTFFMVELAASVSNGEECLGHRTVQGLVVYLATEAAGSVKMRFAARQKHTGTPLPRVIVVQSPINLFDGTADVEAVLQLIEALQAEAQAKVELIIGDTMARISAGANENSGEDMGVVLKNADAIRAATGASFLWVHHCGKDQARGARGWSGIRAAIDTEIEITADDATGIRTAEITKQRDLTTKGLRIGFQLMPVPMGFNRWGSERTSAVVIPAAAGDKPTRAKRPSEIAGAVVELLTSHGAGMLKGRIVKHFDGRYTTSAVYRELTKMLSDGMLIASGGVMALPGVPIVGANQVPTGADHKSDSGLTVVPTSAAPYRGAHVGTKPQHLGVTEAGA